MSKRVVDPVRRRLARLENIVDRWIAAPYYTAADQAGFNGQMLRKQMFAELLVACHFQAIVETGTFVGNTAGYMAEASHLPVFTTESDRLTYHFAKRRLSKLSQVQVACLDSREFIKKLTVAPNLTGQVTFFYLDAHWDEDLPLREEVTLIARHWIQCVIMIDDFYVPGDNGYGYDGYGADKVLDLRYIYPVLKEHNLSAFFPRQPSSEETGSKRGCVVLAKAGKMDTILEEIPSLRPVRLPR